MDTIQLNISKQQFFGMLQAMPEQDKAGSVRPPTQIIVR